MRTCYVEAEFLHCFTDFPGFHFSIAKLNTDLLYNVIATDLYALFIFARLTETTADGSGYQIFFDMLCINHLKLFQIRYRQVMREIFLAYQVQGLSIGALIRQWMIVKVLCALYLNADITTCTLRICDIDVIIASSNKRGYAFALLRIMSISSSIILPVFWTTAKKELSLQC